MTTYLPKENAQVIRMPSTAQLLIDSADTTNSYTQGLSLGSSPFNFSFARGQNLMTGFFTRVCPSEVIIEWDTPNIQIGYNATVSIDVSGVATQTVVFPNGWFNVKETLDYIVSKMNDLSGTTGTKFQVGTNTRGAITLNTIASGAAVVKNFSFKNVATNYLPVQLDCSLGLLGRSSYTIINPDLRLYRYLDFVCNQLTNNQDVRDASTTTSPDVLCRFYMEWDSAPEYDAYDFPILMGYAPAFIRRDFLTPKQIKWNPSTQMGNLEFGVYGQMFCINTRTTTQTAPAPTRLTVPPVYKQLSLNSGLNSYHTAWLMTLQCSEV